MSAAPDSGRGDGGAVPWAAPDIWHDHGNRHAYEPYLHREDPDTGRCSECPPEDRVAEGDDDYDEAMAHRRAGLSDEARQDAGVFREHYQHQMAEGDCYCGSPSLPGIDHTSKHCYYTDDANATATHGHTTIGSATRPEVFPRSIGWGWGDRRRESELVKSRDLRGRRGLVLLRAGVSRFSWYLCRQLGFVRRDDGRE